MVRSELEALGPLTGELGADARMLGKHGDTRSITINTLKMDSFVYGSNNIS